MKPTEIETDRLKVWLSAIRVENEFVSRKALAAGREKEPAASALRLTRHRNQHEWRRAKSRKESGMKDRLSSVPRHSEPEERISRIWLAG